MLQAPKIFISSTIYDFRDLRSALKYYMEQVGLSVYMSEYNDFKKDVDVSSYDTCLKTISLCNYFILLIGSRVGGYYNESEGTSITQMEYRTAYKLAMAGKIKIITLVRKEIWTIKEDRKSLEQHLINSNAIEQEFNIETVTSISNHKSKFINDANFIFNFINEVSRIEEMKTAIRGSAAFPIANWIHPFNSFTDIIDTIRSIIDIDHSISNRVVIENLKRELLNNLSNVTTKNNEGIFRATFLTDKFRETYKISNLRPITVDNKHVRLLIFGATLMSKAAYGLKTTSIESCLKSGLFYTYDTTSGDYIPEPTHEILEILLDRIKSLMGSLHEAKLPNLMSKYLPTAKNPGTMSIESTDFLFLVSAANTCDDVFNLSKAIYLHLTGTENAYKNLSLNSPSPFEDADRQLAKERATPKEVESWLKGSPSV